MGRRPNATGAGRLRAIMRGEAKVTLSKLEQRFLERLQEARLPLPVTNRPAGTKRVDRRWPARQLTVELDSYRYHHSATPGKTTAAASARPTPATTRSAATAGTT